MSMAWAVLYALSRRSSRAGPDPQPQVEVMLLLEGIQGAVCFQLQPGWLPPRAPTSAALLWSIREKQGQNKAKIFVKHNGILLFLFFHHRHWKMLCRHSASTTSKGAEARGADAAQSFHVKQNTRAGLSAGLW